ncbi:2-dehydropantoate 2-reductase [Haliea sp.]|uniref:2-dehydropantoate 2-reductase n=1 Tax=Haliea sp. TaxID=1932666 RepID=UPI0035286F41
MRSRHWHILGAGSIGSLFACLFDKAGISCSLLLRDGDPALTQTTRRIQLRAGGLTSEHSFPVTSGAHAAPIHYLLVCTKAYDLVDGLAGLQPWLAPNAVVVLLANGLGYQQTVAARWPQLAVFSGSTTEGAFREAGQRVLRAGRGTTWIGGRGTRDAPDWFSDWQAIDARCGWREDIDTVLWHKFAINCAINPLTALHRCRNGALAEPGLADEVRALCLEIAAIGQAAGQGEAVAGLYRSVMEVVAATADNRSSMLQDVLAGRPTEIGFLTSFLVATADALGIDATDNKALLAALRPATHPVG